MGEGESLVLLLVYVDDILLFSSSDKEIDGEVKLGTLDPIYVKTQQQPADFLTKRLAEKPRWRCARMAGMSLN
ncbi:hypothetical protein CLOP_g12444 [Closterium sp. NIES-67]|nr:hypothetical protein CLOP_g12444 [Closterium sp. NIES-67]